MVTEPADSGQEAKTSSNKLTPTKQLTNSGVSGSSNVTSEIKNNNNVNKLKRIPKLIIRKKPINKMVQTVDHSAVDNGSNAMSIPKSSSPSTLFTPRSVYSHATLPNVNVDSKKLEPASRKNSSPLSSPPIAKTTLNFFIPTNSRDASVQVGEPPEQLRRQIAKVTPFPVSPPAVKPVARVSPQPQNMSPPIQKPPVMSVAEEKAYNKDKIEAKSPEAEWRTPLKSPPVISSVGTPAISTTTITSASNSVTNITPTKASPLATATAPSTLKTSPTTKTFPSTSCSAQLPIPSNVSLATEQLANTISTMSVSDTAVTTSGEIMTATTTAVKKKKKKKHHSTAEHSGQEDGVGIEHKKKKKKQKKEHKDRDSNDEPKKKKKKVKHPIKEAVWIEKKATLDTASAIKSPLKSPPPASPAVPTASSHDPKNKINKQMAEEKVKQEPIPLPSKCEPLPLKHEPLPLKREPSLPKDNPVASQNTEEAEVEIENKLRPFLLSYYSSSGSDCSSPTLEDRELDDPLKTLPTTTITNTDDVFTKERSIQVTTTVASTSDKADTKQTTSGSVTATHWLGTSAVLANVHGQQLTKRGHSSTVDHHQNISSSRHDYLTVKRNSVQSDSASSASKLDPRLVRLDNSTVNKYDNIIDNRHNKQYSQSFTGQGVSSERQKYTSAKKNHISNASDIYFNQKSSSSITSSRDSTSHHRKQEGCTMEHVSRKNSQRSSSSSDQQEHKYSKWDSSRDPRRRMSSSDCSDDNFSQQDSSGSSYRVDRHDNTSNRQQQQQGRRERHGSSSSRQADDRRDSSSSTGRDAGSSDRQSVRWDGSRWDRQQPSEVVKQLTSHQQYQLGDKVRSWSGQANVVDSSVAVGSKRYRDDWDREYDAGHVKKVHRHTTPESFSSSRNPFQDYQSKKYYNKRGNYNRYDRYGQQQSGYRWRHQPYNSSYRRRYDGDNRNYYRH